MHKCNLNQYIKVRSLHKYTHGVFTGYTVTWLQIKLLEGEQ